VVAAVLCAGIVVAGCGNAPEPKPVDPPAEQPRTAEPTPSKKQEPSPAKTDENVVETGGSDKVDPATEAAAEAFIADYLAAQNKATGNGNFRAVDTMIKSCSVCAESKEYITRAYRGGGGVEGGVFTRPTIEVAGQRDGRIQVSVHAVISAYETTDGSGKVVDEGPAETRNYQYSVSKTGGRWLIVEGSFVG
jgi:hypothetical protein